MSHSKESLISQIKATTGGEPITIGYSAFKDDEEFLTQIQAYAYCTCDEGNIVVEDEEGVCFNNEVVGVGEYSAHYISSVHLDENEFEPIDDDELIDTLLDELRDELIIEALVMLRVNMYIKYGYPEVA